MGIAVDNNGNIFFTPERAGIWKLNLDDKTPRQLVSVDNSMPYGAHPIVWDGKDYICAGGHSVIRQQNIHTFEHQFIEEGRFHNIKAIATDRKGHLYVAETHEVHKIQLNNFYVTTIPLFLYGASGLAVDDKDNIFVADSPRHCIWKVKNQSSIIYAGILDCKGCKDGEFQISLLDSPTDICLDLDGNLLVIDANAIRKIDKQQTITTPTQFFAAKEPQAIAVDQEGNIHVQCRWNIVKFESRWKKERYLWIGKLKENSKDCLLALLPNDIIKEIAEYLQYHSINTHEPQFFVLPDWN